MLIVMGQTGNRTPHKATSGYTSPASEGKIPSPRKHLVEVLSELRDLLEDYAPAWYTEDYHRKVESVLCSRKKH